jgi:hypothetical protein
MAPAAAALGADFPEAEVWHLLDDRLLTDAERAGGLTDPLRARMRRLIDHARRGRADAALLTCSLYGEIALESAAAIPVLAPDQSAFEELAAGGNRRVLVLASFEAALRDSQDRLRRALSAGPHPQTAVTGLVVPAARAPAAAGDVPGLVSALADAVRADAVRTGDQAAPPDAVFLAQYSLAPAGQGLAAALGVPVLSGPASAAAALKSLLGSAR